jgi:hypothetical protein
MLPLSSRAKSYGTGTSWPGIDYEAFPNHQGGKIAYPSSSCKDSRWESVAEPTSVTQLFQLKQPLVDALRLFFGQYVVFEVLDDGLAET